MKRRYFVRMLIVGLLSFPFVRYLLGRLELPELVLEIVRSQLPFLTIEQPEAEKFTAAYVENFGSRELGRYSEQSSLLFVLKLFSFSPQVAKVLQERKRFEESIARKFLLSSNFFPGEVETSPKFIRLYAPERGLACQNPFAQFSI